MISSDHQSYEEASAVRGYPTVIDAGDTPSIETKLHLFEGTIEITQSPSKELQTQYYLIKPEETEPIQLTWFVNMKNNIYAKAEQLMDSNIFTNVVPGSEWMYMYPY
jgi:hypothetical protein